MRDEHARQRGFTLVETLVALAILGLVAASILTLIAQNTRFVAVSEDRVLAGMLADNMLTESLAQDGALERGEQEEEAVFAELDWIWRRTVTETGVDGLVRIDIAVRRARSPQTLAAATTLKDEQR